MKKILSIATIVFAFWAGQAQTTRDEDNQTDFDDKIQQEPPRETQRNLEISTAPSTPAQQNARAQQEAEEKRKREIERSTGQSAENPAKYNTVIPRAQLNQPDSKPLNTN